MEFRQQAKNEFEKDMFKLMNNAVYGKTMQNVKNQQSYKLIENSGLNKQISKVFFKEFE